MPFDWMNAVQQQLAGLPNGQGIQALSGMQPNNFQQNKLMTGSNPNPKFPRARDAWERLKQGAGQVAFGQPGEVQQYPTVTPQQQGIMHLLQQLGVYQLRNPHEGFEGIENQARNQFAQHSIPSLAERFTSMGSNAQSSPLFANMLSQAQGGLESDLASQKSQYGQQGIQQALQMLQLGLNPQSENIYRPAENGLAQNSILALIRSLMPKP